jgi:hypothetical protein
MEGFHDPALLLKWDSALLEVKKMVYLPQGTPDRPLARDFMTSQPMTIEEFGADYTKVGTQIKGSKTGVLYWPEQEGRRIQRATLSIIDLRIGRVDIPLPLRRRTKKKNGDTVRPDEEKSKGRVMFLQSEPFDLNQLRNFERFEQSITGGPTKARIAGRRTP